MGSYSPKTDDANIDMTLINRVLAGEREIFALLVDKYEQRVIYVVSKYVQDPMEALDVTQEVFMRAYSALPKFRAQCAFYTWLYRIATNTAKNHIASRKRTQNDTDFSDIENLIGTEHSINYREDFQSPEKQHYSTEIKGAIENVIHQLPQDLKAAIILREVDGLSYEEIAQVLLCPVGTVRSRIFRAREYLERRMRPFLRQNS